MAIFLKTVGAVVAVVGLLLTAGFTLQITGDEEYRKAALLRERNPGNVLFESEYRVAEARHVFLVYSAASCLLIAVIGGSLLWGLGGLHTRVERRFAMIAAKIDEATSRGDTWG